MQEEKNKEKEETKTGEKNPEENIEEQLIEERKKAVVNFFKKNKLLVFLVLLIALIAWTWAIRTSNIPQLKDVTTGDWTLGPDLDPFLFLRYAKIIAENGSLPAVDSMRYVPLGYVTKGELLMNSYAIVAIHKIFSLDITYAAIIYPVIFFCLSMLAFFFFVRKIFEEEKNKDLIALLSTAFFAFSPMLLHRTTAGIAEKEPIGLFFMFLAFCFFAYALKAKNVKNALIYGAFAGISTGMMGLSWGGVAFIFISVALATFVLFFLEKIEKKHFFAYAAWIIALTTIMSFFTPRFGGIKGLVLSTTSGFAFFVLALLAFDFFLGKKINEKIGKRIKMPQAINSFLLISLLVFIFVLIFSPEMISHFVNDITARLLVPIVDRFNITVAENNQPFFGAWKSQFGLAFFWLFVFASVFLFYENFKNIKEKWLLTAAYFIFVIGLIFSRYSPSHVLDGTSNLAKLVYFGSFALFAAALAFSYYQSWKKKEKFDVFSGHVLLLACFFFGIVSARSMIRLFFLLAPFTGIFVSYAVVKLPEKAIKSKDELAKILLWCLAIATIFFALSSLNNFYKATSAEARYTIPSAYNIQWQLAMSWVRQNTPKDAIFSHWWDYGYWIQTIGERATFLDGGNMLPYWNHLFGRHVLTGRNETEALELLLSHNTSYLLIDPTDIGKYPAYSSIGSDENYDRYSWINTVVLDERATKETRNETIYFYSGGTMLDEDFVWQNQIFPAQRAGIGAFLLPMQQIEIFGKKITSIKQPKAIFVYQGKQVEIPLRYLYSEKLYDFENGIDGCLYIIPKITETGINNIGAALYLSPRAMRALWVKFYFFNQSENFELVHVESDLGIAQLRQRYNLTVSEIADYPGRGVVGPIKIFKINYPSGIETKPEYLETNFPEEKKWFFKARGF